MIAGMLREWLLHQEAHRPDKVVSMRVHGIAQPAGSKRKMPNGAIIDDNPRATDWKKQIGQVAGATMEARSLLLFEGPMLLVATFYRMRPSSHFTKKGLLKASSPQFPSSIPDLTKTLRGLEDGLNGVLWKDDRQVCEQHTSKMFAGGTAGDRPGVHLVVADMEWAALHFLEKLP